MLAQNVLNMLIRVDKGYIFTDVVYVFSHGAPAYMHRGMSIIDS